MPFNPKPQDPTTTPPREEGPTPHTVQRVGWGGAGGAAKRLTLYTLSDFGSDLDVYAAATFKKCHQHVNWWFRVSKIVANLLAREACQKSWANPCPKPPTHLEALTRVGGTRRQTYAPTQPTHPPTHPATRRKGAAGTRPLGGGRANTIHIPSAGVSVDWYLVHALCGGEAADLCCI